MQKHLKPPSQMPLRTATNAVKDFQTMEIWEDNGKTEIGKTEIRKNASLWP